MVTDAGDISAWFMPDGREFYRHKTGRLDSKIGV